MEPFSTAFYHSFTFCGELTKIRGENGRSDDGSWHGSEDRCAVR